MNHRNILIQLLVIVLFASCENKKALSHENLQFSIDINRNDQISIFDLFSKVEIFPLETNENSLLTFPLGEPERVVMYREEFYFLNKQQGEIIIFDSVGNYKKRINKRGGGPEEYEALADFNINRFTDNLELLSDMGKYINIYDRTG